MHLLINLILIGGLLVKFHEANEEIGSCGYGHGDSECDGTCNVRNSKCEMIIDTDMLYCGCTYCNYDATSNQCVGKCQNRQTGKCINRVKEPKADSDCGCFTCKTTFDSSNQIVCGGTCFESGLSCKPANVSAYNFVGFTTECLCQ